MRGRGPPLPLYIRWRGAHLAPMITRPLFAAAFALAATFALGYLGGTQLLGAHPFWATQITLIGAPIGLFLAWLAALRLPGIPAVIGFAILTGAALATARYGQAGFAASFAEDQFAGQLWYFGWIASAAGFAALVASLSRLLPRKS